MKRLVVIILGVVILLTLLYGLLIARIYPPSSPLLVPLLILIGMFTSWKGKYAESISSPELLLAVLMAVSSGALNLRYPPGSVPIWFGILILSAIFFACVGSSLP